MNEKPMIWQNILYAGRYFYRLPWLPFARPSLLRHRTGSLYIEKRQYPFPPAAK